MVLRPNFYAHSGFQSIYPEKNVVFLGGSITDGSSASDWERKPWRILVGHWLSQRRPFVYFNAGLGGTDSWIGLIRLQSDVIGRNPGIVFVDFAVNDQGQQNTGARASGFAPAAEALVRRLRTALPNTLLVAEILCWPNDYSHMTADRRAARDKWLAIASTYAMTLSRLDTWLESIMGTPYNDGQVEVYFAGVGDVHPDDDGHREAANATNAQLAALSSLDYSYPGPLPTRIDAEAADYEYTPILRNGADNDGTTGAWSTSSESIISAQVGATVQWSGTFCSFGLYNGSICEIEWKLDGGAYNALALPSAARRPIWNFTRGAHTITVRVKNGTVQLNQFLAI